MVKLTGRKILKATPVILFVLLAGAFSIAGIRPLAAADAFDFSMSNSGDITVESGGSAGSTTVTVTLVSGDAQSVDLSCSNGLPSGVLCFFYGSSGIPTFTSTVLVATTSSVAAGSYDITVSGSGGGVTHSTTFTLRVNGHPSERLGGVALPVNVVGLIAPYLVFAVAVGASVTAYLRLGTGRKQKN